MIRRLLTRHAAHEAVAIAVVGALVVALALLPTWRNPSFYFADDSAAQFLPMWFRLGERLRGGDWPPLLDVDSWMGGDLAAEALFGLWNPVNLLDYVLVSRIGDLAVAATAVKVQFLVVLAVGVHVLCREYGAARSMSTVLGVATPFSGFVLYFQAGTWAAGLIGVAWLPWAWCSLRRMAHGRSAAVVPFLFSYLCLSSGDPYGVLGLCAVFAALMAETALCRAKDKARRLRALLFVGLATAAALPLVFLPLVMTSPVGWRSGMELYNVGRLAPDLADLINLSMPSFVPQIASFGSFRMTVPAMYFAWFFVPLLPWFDWSVLVREWRRFGAPLVLGGGYALLCLGPSNVWMFRWPIRHVVVLVLALSVITAFLLSRGMRTDRCRARLAGTAGVVGLGAYLSFSAWPALAGKHLVSMCLLAGLGVVVVTFAHRGLPGRSRAVVLQAGTVLALLLQVCWFPVNRDVADYRFPPRTADIRTQFAGLRGGTVLQIADRDHVAARDVDSGVVWKYLLFGNMHAAAGVASLVAYTGLGYESLHRRLCLNYYGATCPRAYAAVQRGDEVGVSLADQLKLEYLVVQRALIDAPVPPPGWRVVERSGITTVLRRIGPPRWPSSRLSVARGVTVSTALRSGQRTEEVRFRRSAGQPAVLVFARLAWPGYRATVDGHRVPAEATSSGLLRVSLPPGTAGGTLRLSWSPPGFAASVVLAVLGALGAIGMSLFGRGVAR
jgi:hypothetical protein